MVVDVVNVVVAAAVAGMEVAVEEVWLHLPSLKTVGRCSLRRCCLSPMRMRMVVRGPAAPLLVPPFASPARLCVFSAAKGASLPLSPSPHELVDTEAPCSAAAGPPPPPSWKLPGSCALPIAAADSPPLLLPALPFWAAPAGCFASAAPLPPSFPRPLASLAAAESPWVVPAAAPSPAVWRGARTPGAVLLLVAAMICLLLVKAAVLVGWVGLVLLLLAPFVWGWVRCVISDSCCWGLAEGESRMGAIGVRMGAGRMLGGGRPSAGGVTDVTALTGAKGAARGPS